MVRLTYATEQDIAALYTYDAEGDPDRAEGVSRALIGASDGLVDVPLMGREGKVASCCRVMPDGLVSRGRSASITS